MNFPPLFISCMDWGIYMWSSRDHFTISGNVELARIFKSIGIVKPQGESAIGIHIPLPFAPPTHLPPYPDIFMC